MEKHAAPFAASGSQAKEQTGSSSKALLQEKLKGVVHIETPTKAVATEEEKTVKAEATEET
jgi:hypothetical protein